MLKINGKIIEAPDSVGEFQRINSKLFNAACKACLVRKGASADDYNFSTGGRRRSRRPLISKGRRKRG
jgi:hypothetical protein